jgi:hypothetical protein
MSVAVAAAAATPSPSVIEQTAMATMVARRSTASTATTAETDESSDLEMQEGSRVLQLLENAAVAASYGDSVMNLCQKSENLFIKNGGGDSDVITSNNRRVLAGNNGDVLYNSGGVTVKSSLELMEEDDDLPLVISQRQQEQQLQQQLKQQQQLEKVLVTDGVDPDPRFEPPSGDHQLMHMPDTIFILCSDEKDDSDAFQNAMR